MKNIIRFFKVISKLKKSQIKNLIKKRIFKINKKPLVCSWIFKPIIAETKFPFTKKTFQKEQSGLFFRFAGKRSAFKSWEEGPDQLWLFNLHYLEFVLQQEMDKETALYMIKDWFDASSSSEHKIFNHPYPASIRIFSLIKFLLIYSFKDAIIEKIIFKDISRVYANLEYDIDGNHLLTNLLALKFGLSFIEGSDELNKIRKEVDEKLDIALKEQVFEDGGHFERSFMYTLITTSMILDIINIKAGDKYKPIASRMLSFINAFTSSDKIPLFNDAGDNITYYPSELLFMGKSLGLEIEWMKPKTKVFQKSNFAVLSDFKRTIYIDGGGFPPFQPGHAHSSALSFELYDRGRKLFYDSGCKDYENNSERSFLRSSKAHNTISVDNNDQHEMWKSFRIASRGENYPLTGYAGRVSGWLISWKNVYHERIFELEEESFHIKDTLKTAGKHSYEIYFYFNPVDTPIISEKKIISSTFELESSSGEMILEKTEIYNGFNTPWPAYRSTIKGTFKDKISLSNIIRFI